MPHNIFLHSALVQSRKIDRSHRHRVRDANIYNAIESAVALFVSFIINMFVVAVFASTFYANSQDSRVTDGLDVAGEMLGEKFGTAAKYVWAIGLLAAGQSSVMTGTYAGQVTMQGFLQLKLAPWKRVLLTRSVAIVPSVLVAVFASGFTQFDQLLNVLQSVLLPFAILPVLKLTANRRVMGEFRTHLFWRVTGLHRVVSLF